jgi:hypothetical protein
MFTVPSNFAKSARILSYYVPLVPRIGVSYAGRFSEICDAWHAGPGLTRDSLDALDELAQYSGRRIIPPDETGHFVAGMFVRGATIALFPILLGEGPFIEGSVIAGVMALLNWPMENSGTIADAEETFRCAVRREKESQD